MDMTVSWEVDTTSADDTEKVAERIGHNLKGGETIELVGDLGGGKTTFVRGLARGLGSSDQVSSPTFKISNEYHGRNLVLNHFDLYRLGEAGIISNELAEIIDDQQAVLVIEWADAVKNILPVKRLVINFVPKSENVRQLKITYPETLNYVLKEVQK